MNITVIGAGKGGHAIAGYTSLLGNDVTLLTHTFKKKKKIEEKNNIIDIKGIIQGSSEIKEITMDVKRAVQNKDLIFIVTDATVHKDYAIKMAPYFVKNNSFAQSSYQHVVLLSPGVGGALEFYKTVFQINPKAKITVSETDTLPYACKVPKIGTSYIKAIKNSIVFTTLPKKHSIENIIQRLYPQFKYMNNSLIGIDDSPVFHICGMIFNSDKIKNKQDFNFYIDGITPKVAQFMEEMDLERLQVAEKLGVPSRSVKDWLNIVYGVNKSSLYEMIQNTPPYQNTIEEKNRSPAPKTLNHRYLVEEIMLRAVPTVSIANVFGLKLSKYEQMINKASELLNRNFWKEGRTIKDMGLSEQNILYWSKKYGIKK